MNYMIIIITIIQYKLYHLYHLVLNVVAPSCLRCFRILLYAWAYWIIGFFHSSQFSAKASKEFSLFTIKSNSYDISKDRYAKYKTYTNISKSNLHKHFFLSGEIPWKFHRVCNQLKFFPFLVWGFVSPTL